MAFYVFILLVVGLIFYIYGINRFSDTRPWQMYCYDVYFSAEEFYKSVEDNLRAQELPGVSFGRESFMQSHVLSAWREYLKISRGDLIFYVCVAKFGNGTFVSSWQCLKRSWILSRFPPIAKIFGKNGDYKSFYQQDAAAMYTAVVQEAVTKLLDEQLETQGKRLSDFNRKYIPA